MHDQPADALEDAADEHHHELEQRHQDEDEQQHRGGHCQRHEHESNQGRTSRHRVISSACKRLPPRPGSAGLERL
jgi:hypothetical protein